MKAEKEKKPARLYLVFESGTILLALLLLQTLLRGFRTRIERVIRIDFHFHEKLKILLHMELG